MVSVIKKCHFRNERTMKKSYIGLNKLDLDTPCLVIDKKALEFNLDIMRQHAIKNSINIRPHCKTHKCSKLALMQLQYGAIGISAAKISEAEVLIKNGIPNILLTSPIVTKNKIARLISCVEASPNIIVVLDNLENANALNCAGQSIKKKICVLIDLDAGIGRTGIDPISAVDLGLKITDLECLNLTGIQCYAGNLQHIKSFNERKRKSLAIMQQASNVVKTLKNLGLPCPILTGSGTGTYDIDIEASEVTEIQPGSYAVMDVEYAAIESKNNKSFAPFKHAMTLLTSVISSNRKEHVTVDAGTKSIYVDSTNRPKIISHPGLEYDWGGFGDEHCKIYATNHSKLPKNADVLELVVPHCDPTINLYDKFYIVDNDIVIDIWDIDLRGKSQ